MMNLLALGLIVSTLTAAGVLTPPVNPPQPSHRHPASDHVLREGHRVIVVEYERQVPADSGTGVTNGEAGDTGKALSGSAKDKICDAYGVCRDKLSSAASEVEHAVKGAKDKFSGLFHHGKDKLSDTEEAVKGAKDKVLDAKDAAENKLFQAKEATEDKVLQAKDATKDKLSRDMDASKDKLSQSKEVTNDKLSQAGEKMMDVVTGAKEAAKDKLSQTKEVTEDKVSEAKGKVGDKLSHAENNVFEAKEKAKEKSSEMQEEIKDRASILKEGMKETKAKAGEMAEETARNLTDIARRACDVAYDMAAYLTSPRASRFVWAVAQLLGFATAYGTCVWVTFISSNVLVSSLPRLQFGMMQSKVYPVYFRAVAYGISIAFLGQIFGRGKGTMVDKLQACNLLGALGMVLVNMLFLEPNATKVMFERIKAEKEEGRGHNVPDMVERVSDTTTPSVTGLASLTTTTTTTTTESTGLNGNTKSTSETEMQSETSADKKLRMLSARLGRWNSYSSLVNVVTLMALTWHLVHLASLISCCQ